MIQQPRQNIENNEILSNTSSLPHPFITTVLQLTHLYQFLSTARHSHQVWYICLISFIHVVVESCKVFTFQTLQTLQ